MTLVSCSRQDECDRIKFIAGSDSGAGQRVWWRGAGAEALGTPVSEILHGAGRGLHAGDSDRGDGASEPCAERRTRRVPDSHRLSAHTLLRAYGDAALSLRRRDTPRRVRTFA